MDRGEIVAMGICIAMLPFIGHVDRGGCGSASFVGLCILPHDMRHVWLVYCIVYIATMQYICLQRQIYICTIAIAYLITLNCWERNLKEMEGSLSFCTKRFLHVGNLSFVLVIVAHLSC